jgi:colicin import membrane protein
MMIEKYHNLEPDMKKMIFMSLTLHLALLLMFTIKMAFFTSDVPRYEPAIRVDILGLPDKRDPDKPLTAPSPTPAPEAVKAPPEKREAKAIPKVETKTNTVSQSAALNKLKSLSAIEKLKAMADKSKEERVAEKPAAEVVKGNVLAVGSALKGLNKMEFNQYIGSLDVHVKNNWALPEWMLSQGFKAEVMIKIDKTGQIIERRLVKKSGNAEFDDRVMAAIEKSNPFPPPPDKFVDLVGIQGITFAFPE